MFRPVNYLLPGLILVLGLTMAWAGRARLQGGAPANAELLSQVRQCDEALMLEIRALRHDIEELKRNLSKGADLEPKAGVTPALVKEGGRGKIIHIDPADQTLVEVNLGSKDGLEKHSTLDIFRQGSPSEYLGMLRIFEVYGQSSFCRIVGTNPIKLQPIQIGDQVRKKEL
jgi:hypothetical protein